MEAYKKILICFVLIYFTVFVSAQSSHAQAQATQEWVDIPVVVNIIDSSDSNNVDAAINKANDIFKQAHIRLIVKKTNKNVNAGNNDADLTENEGDKAQENGQKELNNVLGAGKGIKLTFADDVWTQQPATNGWSIHRNPVVFVETDDPNTMGNVTAHEIVHALTISGHSNDSNDLMYESTPRGTNIRPSDVNEIFPRAKKLGKPYFITPRVLPGRSVIIPAGADFGIDMFGAVLDESNDLNVYNPSGGTTNHENPSIQYANLQAVDIFSDEPFALNGNATIEFQLNGPLPDIFVDTYYDMYFDTNLVQQGPEAMVGIHIFGQPDSLTTEAMLNDLVSNQFTMELPPPIIRDNQKFDGGTDTIANNSVEVTIPIEIVQLNLVSSEPIHVDCQSFAYDYSGGFSQQPLQLWDQTEFFQVSLTDTCPVPGITFTAPQVPEPMNPPGANSIIISGCGFTGDVGIELDGLFEGIAAANEQGKFTHLTDPQWNLEHGVHSVIAKELDDTAPNGANHAIGFFLYCPDGEDCEICNPQDQTDTDITILP